MSPLAPSTAPSTRGRHVRRRTPLSRTRRLSAGSLAVLGFGFLFWAGVGGVAFQQSAQAAPVSVNQCNGIATTPGLEVTCDVSVVNNLNLSTNVSSSTVTLTVCQGAANVTPTCATPTTTSYADLTTSVTQCNGSVLGGGGVIICSVHVANNIVGSATTTAATINQCNGSGQGGGVAVTCTPTASTTGATITQCNGSGNGGAGVSVTCTVTPSTQTAALPVTVNQCIGSGNGGGSVVTCTVSLTNQIIPATVTTAPGSATPTNGTSGASGSGANGSGASGSGTNASGSNGSGSNGSGSNGSGANGSGANGSGGGNGAQGGASRSAEGTRVISAPVLAPALRSSASFTAPAGLTGDSAPATRHDDPLLWALALGCLSAGLLLIAVRPSH